MRGYRAMLSPRRWVRGRGRGRRTIGAQKKVKAGGVAHKITRAIMHNRWGIPGGHGPLKYLVNCGAFVEVMLGGVAPEITPAIMHNRRGLAAW
jgi:hypothetical protein